MIEVALYGKPSSRYEHLKLVLNTKLDEAGIDIRLTEINDVETFIRDNVHSIPAVRLNNRMYFECPEDINIDDFTDNVIKNILMDNDSRMMRIVVPIDFSAPAANAIEYAASLAELSGVGIHILHAYHPIPVQVNGAVWVDPDAARNGEHQLKDFVDDVIKRHPEVSITSSFEYGFPVDTLIKFSQQPDTKYIVMGSKGSNNTIRQLFGSVSQEVSQKANCPVFVIPENSSFTLKQIVYATDNPVLDASGLRMVHRLAKLTDARIHIVHVNSDNADSYGRKWLNEIKTVFPELKNYTISEAVNKSVVEGLLGQARSQKADLVVVATTHRSFWDSIFHKSTTKELLLNLGDQPIMIFHQGDR